MGPSTGFSVPVEKNVWSVFEKHRNGLPFPKKQYE
jgi:hypothetical protein